MTIVDFTSVVATASKTSETWLITPPCRKAPPFTAGI